MRRLLIATENKGKRRELQQLLDDLPSAEGLAADLDLVLPSQLGLTLKVEETGSTYAENAILKALAYARASGLTALADDSGLEVDALSGAPGLYSTRYSPLPGATDADRRAHLLANLSDKPRPWTARFRATVAISTPDGEVRTTEGVCPGEIIPEERGTGGFGYDPIFLLAGGTQTMAELPEHEKNRLSHRGRAVRAAIPILREVLGL